MQEKLKVLFQLNYRHTRFIFSLIFSPTLPYSNTAMLIILIMSSTRSRSSIVLDLKLFRNTKAPSNAATRYNVGELECKAKHLWCMQVDNEFPMQLTPKTHMATGMLVIEIDGLARLSA